MLLPPLPVIAMMIASTHCWIAHDGSGTMPMSGSAAATTCAAGMSLAAPSSSARMRATLSMKDMPRGRKEFCSGAINEVCVHNTLNTYSLG